jgi:nucleoid-associated protein YgaU
MKATEFLKIAAITAMTAGFAVGCASGGSDSTAASSSDTSASTDAAAVVEECQGTTPEARNAIYAAKLKNARARNLGYEWRDTAKLITEAEKAAEDCEHVRAKILANKAEEQAADAIAQYQAQQAAQTEVSGDSGSDSSDSTMSSSDSSGSSDSSSSSSSGSKFLGGYLVVNGDNLWNIAGQDGVYGNPFQWPLIYKANSGQIKDADLIFPGQYFYIPKAMGSQRAAAISHAKNRGAWTVGEAEASDLDYLSE